MFGATEPLVTPYVGSLPVDGGGTVDLDRRPPRSGRSSRRASQESSSTVSSRRRSVRTSARSAASPASDASGWVYKVNGVSPPVGATAYVVKHGDERALVLRDVRTDSGGPPTLDLVRAGRSCFRAISVDDSGARSQATGVVFRVDARTVQLRERAHLPVRQPGGSCARRRPARSARRSSFADRDPGSTREAARRRSCARSRARRLRRLAGRCRPGGCRRRAPLGDARPRCGGHARRRPYRPG